MHMKPINLNNSYKKMITEYHEPGVEKDNAGHYIDFIQSISIKGNLNKPRYNINYYIKKGCILSKEWLSKLNITPDIAYKKLLNTFNNEGMEIKNGLIYVERMLHLPDFENMDKIEKSYTFNKDESLDTSYYDKLRKAYNSVGECWSWKKNNAVAYCAHLASSVEVILKGWVNPNNVNWCETVYVNCYHMSNETEIRLSDKHNAYVQIDEILINGVSYDFDGPRIVKASAYKYCHSPFHLIAKLNKDNPNSTEDVMVKYNYGNIINNVINYNDYVYVYIDGQFIKYPYKNAKCFQFYRNTKCGIIIFNNKQILFRIENDNFKKLYEFEKNDDIVLYNSIGIVKKYTSNTEMDIKYSFFKINKNENTIVFISDWLSFISVPTVNGYGFLYINNQKKFYHIEGNEVHPITLEKALDGDLQLKYIFETVKKSVMNELFYVKHKDRWNILKNRTLLLEKWMYEIVEPNFKGYGLLQEMENESYQIYYINPKSNKVYILTPQEISSGVIDLYEMFNEAIDTPMNNVYIVKKYGEFNILKDGKLLLKNFMHFIDEPNSNGYGRLQFTNGLWQFYHIEGDEVNISRNKYYSIDIPDDDCTGWYKTYFKDDLLDYQIKGNKVYDAESGTVIDELIPVSTTISEQHKRINRIVQEVLNEYIIRNYKKIR